MAVQATDQHIEVFMDAILVVQTSVDIVNISKIDDEGNAEPGGIVDLFPVGSPATGKGTIIFRIKVIDKSELPNLRNMTQSTIPMAYVKEVMKLGEMLIFSRCKLNKLFTFTFHFKETFNELAKSGVKFGAFMIKYFTYFGWLMVLSCLGMIGAGAGLIYLDKKMTTVEAMPEEPDEE
jgi:hypothetical protein